MKAIPMYIPAAMLHHNAPAREVVVDGVLLSLARPMRSDMQEDLL